MVPAVGSGVGGAGTLGSFGDGGLGMEIVVPDGSLPSTVVLAPVVTVESGFAVVDAAVVGSLVVTVVGAAVVESPGAAVVTVVGAAVELPGGAAVVTPDSLMG